MKLDINIYKHTVCQASPRILAELKQIKEITMANQAQIDALRDAVEAAKVAIAAKIAEETQQVKDFIDAHPDLDTSGLEAAVAGLAGIGDSVDEIMPDPAPEPEPEPEPIPEG